jgi:hypothetical protein
MSKEFPTGADFDDPKKTKVRQAAAKTGPARS